MSDTTKSTVVLYHANCADGFGAAWAAWRKFGEGASYVPVSYGQEPPKGVLNGNKHVYILDFSYDRETLERIKAVNASLLVLDHHKTAEVDLTGLPYAKFDMTKSGAVLAWEYFWPGEEVPKLLLYVQDRDLWQWKLPMSREFSAALSVESLDFVRWDALAASSGTFMAMQFIPTGDAVLEHQAKLVASLCDKAYFCTLAGHDAPAVNSPLFQSEVGEELCRRHSDASFAAIYFDSSPTHTTYSLRSRNGFDVSAVAKLFNGGGHAAAAGFTVAKGRDVK